jgi:nucleoside transporter
MAPGLRARLSAMMFLEFFVWGSWITVLGVYMDGLGFGAHRGDIYGLLGLASIFMPMIAGQITDRLFATQKFLGIAHLIGGAGLLLAAMAKADSYWLLYTGMLVWSLTYAPTISLTNSLAFSHMKDPEKDFGLIRVFGTIGWIVGGLALSFWRNIEALKIGGNDCLYLAGGAAILMGLFCFSLPDTPPARTGVSAFAFVKAFSLLKNPRISTFLLVSFVGGLVLQFYFNPAGTFLKAIGTDEKNLPWMLGIGQAFEILAMLALPWFLKTYGPRNVLFFGMLALALRNLVFALGQPYALVAASIGLHGISFVFFFVVGFIFIDMVAPRDIKASAQGLLTLIVFGFGFWLGNIFETSVEGWFSKPEGGTDWAKLFLVPTVISAACAVVFMLTFPKGSMKETSGAPATPEPIGADSH